MLSYVKVHRFLNTKDAQHKLDHKLHDLHRPVLLILSVVALKMSWGIMINLHTKRSRKRRKAELSFSRNSLVLDQPMFISYEALRRIENCEIYKYLYPFTAWSFGS